MKRALFFVLLLLLEPSLISQNLVVNPGFETWEKAIKPVGWITTQNCLKDSAFIKSGSYSCRHDGGTGTKYLGQTLSVFPGRQYLFSFFYRTEITGSGNGCRIWCYWKDISGNTITDLVTDAILRPSKYLKSNIWEQVSILLTSPSEAVSFYLEVRTYPNSIAYWDDFIFEENLITYKQEERFSDMLIYPNPAHNYLTISNIQELQNIDIHDFAGKHIWSSNFHGELSVTIPLSGFNEGMYIIRIRTSNAFITRKIILKAE